MYIIAATIDWKAAVRRREDGTLETAFSPDEEDNVFVGDPPEIPESATLYRGVAEVLTLIRPLLSPTTATEVGSIMENAINTDYLFPTDLGEADGLEDGTGTLSPARSEEVSREFQGLRIEELEAALKSPLVADGLEKLRTYGDEYAIAHLGSYLNCWRELFAYATKMGAGIVILMG